MAAVVMAASAAAAPPDRLVDGKPLSQWINVVRTGDTQSPDWPKAVAALKDPSHHIRATAARSLGNLGREGMPAVAALTAALADDKDLVRTAAQEALRKIRQ